MYRQKSKGWYKHKDFIFMEGKLFGQDAHKYYHDLLRQLENKYLT